MLRVHLGAAIVLVAACHRSVAPRPAASPVTIARTGAAKARVIVLTGGVAIKETGPAETVRTFGEVYDFIPQTIIVRLEEPTQISFWNLQPDDEHDFMLTDPQNQVLLTTKLPPLSRNTFVMTFHEPGLFPFYCTVHQPAMSGQILVVAQGVRSRQDQ
ncbi:MAG: cupredoxin domain-containing protein [Thermoanaerobaculia bacterium]